MSKYNNIYDVNEWSAEVIEMKAQGFATRHIARSLFDRESYRNRLNAFFKREDVAEQIEKRQQEIEFAKCVDPLIFKCAFENDYTDWEVKEKPSLGEVKKKPTILVIADTQAKSEEDLEYLLWIGKYIADKKPDTIVHIGDHFDMPSLSSYDKGTSKIEGKRLYKDIEAGVTGFKFLNLELEKHKDYKPRKVFCLGNHEERLDRYVNEHPELQGTLGTDKLPFAEYGWEVHPFLKPVEIEGIFFVHYLANPMSGKPYGGSAMNILKTVGRSFVVGHKQCLDVAIRPTIDGKQQLGIVNGACYDHFESYKGYSGNNHFRGLTVLHECSDGFAVPMFVSLDYMREKYYD
jgi:hypothetical protein